MYIYDIYLYLYHIYIHIYIIRIVQELNQKIQNRWAPWNQWQHCSRGGTVCFIGVNPTSVDTQLPGKEGCVWCRLVPPPLWARCSFPEAIHTLLVIGRKVTPQSLLQGPAVPNHSVQAVLTVQWA